MMMVSCAWSALMRRNLIYRKRNWGATLAELVLPVLFCVVLVALTNLAEQSDHFQPQQIPAQFSSDVQTIQIFSFTDYVKALQAKRICLNKTSARESGTDNNNTSYKELAYFRNVNNSNFEISGMPQHGRNWQVPFVQCDSRRCQHHGEEAYRYCHYPKLALAPSSLEDKGGLQRAKTFRDYMYDRYPQLQNNSLPAFNKQSGHFIRIFDSNQAVEEYTQHVSYGDVGMDHPKLAMAIIFTGNDRYNYDYTLRVNSTNNNAPEWGRKDVSTSRTTPDTKRLFDNYAKQEVAVCGRHVHGHHQGPLQYSCTGQYILNGLLTMQRFLHDWVMVDSGAHEKGFFVAEHGAKFTSFPSRAFLAEGFYAVLNGFLPLFLTLGLLYPCASMISYVAQERELGQKEFLKMMSVTEWQIGSSWFCTFLSLHIATALVLARVSSPLFARSDQVILWIFWQSTFLALIAFSSSIPSMISSHAKTATRTALIGLLILLAGYFMAQAVDMEDGSSFSIFILCLHPITAFSYGIQELGRLEDAGVGATWTSFGATDSPSGFTLLTAITFLLVDSIAWTILSWYCNRVIATNDEGYALPYTFPFRPSYWVRQSSEKQIPFQYTAARMDDDIPMEPVSEALGQQADMCKSVELHNLRKVFPTKTGSSITAVDGINLSLHQGQISALLGPNGSGKSTTIGMLTGAIRPTDGFHVVAGKHSMTQMPEIRQHLGICLQQNDCLFPRLTVREHLEFFNRLKGVYQNSSRREADAKVDQALQDVALAEKSATLAMHLSGGMKRKLCVAIAFAGDSNVVILDEPTSGMDPFSRRFIWNLIKQYKQERIILLTTHFLDEADILADKIAILANGRLRCVGSSLFLKKTYGVGYHLAIEKSTSSRITDEDNGGTGAVNITSAPVKDASYHDSTLKEIVTSAVKEANLLTNVGKEMTFQLPLESNSRFGAMLRDLDAARIRGAICSYGLNMTTLEEVFQRVTRGEESNAIEENNPVIASCADASADISAIDDPFALATTNPHRLFWKHMAALLRKRMISFKRDKKAWCCTTLLPGIFVLVGFLALKYASPTKDLEPLFLDLENYNLDTDIGAAATARNPIPYNNEDSYFKCQPGWCAYQYPITQVRETKEMYFFCGAQSYLLSSPSCSISMSHAIVDRITDGGARPVGEPVHNVNESSHSILESSNLYGASRYGAIYFTHEPNSTTVRGFSYGKKASNQCYNHSGHYMRPQECNLYAGLGYVIGYNFTALHASPLYQKLADEAILREAFDDNRFRLSATIHPLPMTITEGRYSKEDDVFNLWFMVVLSFPFIAGYMGNFVLVERLSKAKHLQTIAGVHPATYWISTFVWDTVNYQMPLWFTVCLMYVFDVDVFTTTERDTIEGVVSLLFLFGPAAASFAYCVSFFFTSASLCNISIIMIGFLTGLGAPIATYMLRLIGSDPDDPWEKLVHIAQAIEWGGRFIPSFCLGKGLLYTIYIGAFERRGAESISVWDEDILLFEVIALLLQSLGYLLVAILLDRLQTNLELRMCFSHMTSFLSCRFQTPYQACATDDALEDCDVLDEEERVMSSTTTDDAVVVQQLRKVYDNGKVAVSDLSLGIQPGECFGLLGINGAGKTTAMGILTGEFPPTSGDVLLAGRSVIRNPEHLRSEIGYCPQFDALYENLSGRDHVELYASIKGIPSDHVRQAADRKLSEVGFNDYDKDRLSQHYSGGMKRKLSIACATISNPLVVCLDEPSTGVDPVARREIWRVISALISKRNPKTNKKTCAILTTHSMTECESLCSRIGIMKNGKLLCLGSAQRLKSKFGRGYQLEFKVRAVEEYDDDYSIVRNKLVHHHGDSIYDLEATDPDEDTFFNLEQAQEALTTLTGDKSLSNMVAADDPSASGIFKDACSCHGVSLPALASFATLELRVRNLDRFLCSTYAGAVLRERQDMKTRYEVNSENVVLADIFVSIEEHKIQLKLSEYGVSQTSLELVFNTLVAEHNSDEPPTQKIRVV